MGKKRKETDGKTQQLHIFNEEAELASNLSNESDDDWLQDDLGFDFEPSDRTVKPQTRELLTLKLLREAIQTQNPDDQVMSDFAEYVLPNLLRVAIGVTAKGGKFFDKIDRKNEAEGKAKVRRNNAADQSLNTHLLNGLFPTNLIEQRLKKLDTTVRRVVRERERRIVIAGFILHDFEKFNYELFPEMPEKYREIRQDKNRDIRKLSVPEHREIIDVFVRALSLDRFMCPDNPESWHDYRDDLLFVAYNAQRRNDTNLNLSEHGLNPILRDRTLRCLCDLTCLADSLASIIKHPQDAENRRLQELIHSLSDGQLKFTYHSIAENRGVLTNVVNNAMLKAHTSLNTEDSTYYEPLLYLPTGVIYLATRNAPPISTQDLPQRVIDKIKALCASQLRNRQTGFVREGKGMKYPEYYNLFCDDVVLMRIALDATLRNVRNSKAQDRSANLVKFQQLGVLPADYDFKFEDDIRIDQIAEFGDLVSRKIWGERVNRIEAERKKNKKLPKLLRVSASNFVLKSTDSFAEV